MSHDSMNTRREYQDKGSISVQVDVMFFFFFQAEDGIRDIGVTGVQTCALPISKALDCLGLDLLEGFRPFAGPGEALGPKMLGQGLEGGVRLQRLAALAPEGLEGGAVAGCLEPSPQGIEQRALDGPGLLIIDKLSALKSCEALLYLGMIQKLPGAALRKALHRRRVDEQGFQEQPGGGGIRGYLRPI